MIPQIDKIKYSTGKSFFLIAGPCVVENSEVCEAVAREVSVICEALQIPYIFKASYRKANRSRSDSFSGIGNKQALEIIANTAAKYNLPCITDIHESHEAAMVANYTDALQIPAFLCRQTDLLTAAAHTGKYVNVKKGQFLSADAMKHAVQKIKDAGNNKVMLTERGTTFGYQDLVVDYRGIPVMQSFGVPVVMDCTHSLQQPNQANGVTGGQPALIETIARAAIATGADGLFIETHPNPEKALSDGANMLPLSQLANLLERLIKIRNAIL